MMSDQPHSQPPRPPSTGAGSRAAVTRPFRTPVRGHAFAPRAPGANDPIPGQLARLVREPDNPADTYAVSVWVAGGDTGRWRIGYLDRLVAARLAPRLDDGARIAAQIDGWTPEPDGRWRRPLLVLLPDAADEPDRMIQPVPTRSPSGDGDGTGTGSGSPGNGDSNVEVERRATLWGRPPGVARRVVSRA